MGVKSQEVTECLHRNNGIPRDKPIVTQISRYDPWKDPVGVGQAFKLARKHADCRLLLVGDKAADDPDIHILLFSPSIPAEINAFQRGSDIILQKSIREGFALTVSEALRKNRPVIGGAVGGIPSQIIDGYTGLLVYSVEGAGLAIRRLLTMPGLARRLGDQGATRVREEFLITKNLKRYLLLLLSLEKPGEDQVFLH